jgi:hypothetical protein
VANRGTRRQRKKYTGFGKALQRLMVDRDIRSWTHLEAVLEEKTGRSYSHQSMTKYAFGDNVTPPEFVMAFADALELTREERRDLAEQYAYHSRPE